MLPIFTVVLSLASDLFTDRSLPTFSHHDHFHQRQLQHPLDVEPADHRDWVTPMSAAIPYNGAKIKDRSNWVVTCDSEQDKEHSCQNTVDGNSSTFWLANRTHPAYSNYITIDLGFVQNVSGIAVEGRQDKSDIGNVAAHEAYLSKNGRDWDQVSYGTWWSDDTEKNSGFETFPARYVRLDVLSDGRNSTQTAIAEFNVYVNPVYAPTPPSGNLGKWGLTINTPIVPVTALVDPFTHNVVMLSSKRHDNFAQDRPSFTLVATWDPTRRVVSQAKVEDTEHNMFCPGTTLDAHGRMIISGGSTGKVTSIYNGAADDGKQWSSGARLNYIRGYHGAVLQSDGRMFVIGGSWGDEALTEPEERIKNGEIYDPETDTWTMLPFCLARPMMTQDRQYYRRDNHPSLFAWKNNTAFHAGPSKNMNWYTLDGEGGWKSAGIRQQDDTVGNEADKSEDAMCGQAIMYDAVEGKIIAFGGAPDYFGGRNTTNRAFHLTLGEANGTVKVENAEPMHHNRTYATAVVLPDGNVLSTGGNGGVPQTFNDTNPVLEAEMYHSSTGHWQALASNSVVRGYHSWTLLLPDATVLSGGGGLCGDFCDVNHFDAQIYSPPYLFTSDGLPARRPIITSATPTEVAPGGTVRIETDIQIGMGSLVRYGGTTHTVNNDQRRIPLTLHNIGERRYEVYVPKEGYVAVPGYWMLFVMDIHGVPSVASTIRITVE